MRETCEKSLMKCDCNEKSRSFFVILPPCPSRANHLTSQPKMRRGVATKGNKEEKHDGGVSEGQMGGKTMRWREGRGGGKEKWLARSPRRSQSGERGEGGGGGETFIGAGRVCFAVFGCGRGREDGRTSAKVIECPFHVVSVSNQIEHVPMRLWRRGRRGGCPWGRLHKWEASCRFARRVFQRINVLPQGAMTEDMACDMMGKRNILCVLSTCKIANGE